MVTVLVAVRARRRTARWAGWQTRTRRCWRSIWETMCRRMAVQGGRSCAGWRRLRMQVRALVHWPLHGLTHVVE